MGEMPNDLLVPERISTAKRKLDIASERGAKSGGTEAIPCPSHDLDDDDDEEYIDEDERSIQKRGRKSEKSMSTSKSKSQGTKEEYSCSMCHRTDFLSPTGFAHHQSRCDGTRNSTGPWTCSNCGKNDFSTSQAYGGHARCCHPRESVTETSISLAPKSLMAERARLSEFNFCLTASLELFEASNADVEKQLIGNGRRHILLGNVGIRCSFCAMSHTMSTGAITYPHHLKPLPHNCYVMVQRHLLGNCTAIPDSIRKRLVETKKSSINHSMKKNALGLPFYLNMIIEKFKLTDDGKRNGIRRSE